MLYLYQTKAMVLLISIPGSPWLPEQMRHDTALNPKPPTQPSHPCSGSSGQPGASWRQKGKSRFYLSTPRAGEPTWWPAQGVPFQGHQSQNRKPTWWPNAMLTMRPSANRQPTVEYSQQPCQKEHDGPVSIRRADSRQSSALDSPADKKTMVCLPAAPPEPRGFLSPCRRPSAAGFREAPLWLCFPTATGSAAGFCGASTVPSFAVAAAAAVFRADAWTDGRSATAAAAAAAAAAADLASASPAAFRPPSSRAPLAGAPAASAPAAGSDSRPTRLGAHVWKPGRTLAFGLRGAPGLESLEASACDKNIQRAVTCDCDQTKQL
jgi:hypothetical protein